LTGRFFRPDAAESGGRELKGTSFASSAGRMLQRKSPNQKA
jgi:hypothetical protein